MELGYGSIAYKDKSTAKQYVNRSSERCSQREG